jgi:hypothetical protein
MSGNRRFIRFPASTRWKIHQNPLTFFPEGDHRQFSVARKQSAEKSGGKRTRVNLAFNVRQTDNFLFPPARS